MLWSFSWGRWSQHQRYTRLTALVGIVMMLVLVWVMLALAWGCGGEGGGLCNVYGDGDWIGLLELVHRVGTVGDGAARGALMTGWWWSWLCGL